MPTQIYIVDHQTKTRQVFSKHLNDAGFGVHTAGTSQEALTRVKALQPDIILANKNLPDIDGFELHRRIRQQADTANIPFLLLAGEDTGDARLPGLRLGVDDYILRPFKLPVLLRKIKDLVDRAHQIKTFSSGADFGGNLKQLGIPDVMQILEMNQKTGELVLLTADGVHVGSAWFQKGKSIDAHSRSLSGVEALLDLIYEKEGHLEFYTREIHRPVNIDQNHMAILLEARSLHDHGQALTQLLPDLDTELQASGQAIPADLANRHQTGRLERVVDRAQRPIAARALIDSQRVSRLRREAELAELLEARVLIVTDPATAPTPGGHPRHRAEPTPQLFHALAQIGHSAGTGIVNFPQAPLRVSIFCENGQVVHAFHGSTTGRKALIRLLSDPPDEFEFQPQPVAVAHTIKDNLERLTTAARKEAAWRQRLNRTQLDWSVHVDVAGLNRAQKRLRQSGLREVLSLAQQYERVGEVIDASALSDYQAYRALVLLAREGVLKIDPGHRPELRLVTDSTADLPPEMIRHHNITVAPLYVNLGGDVYRDGVNLTPQRFYELLALQSEFPTTSPVQPTEFNQIFKDLVGSNDILGIFISSQMSRTCGNALAALEENRADYEDVRSRQPGSAPPPPQFSIIDSQLVSFGLGLLVIEAAEKAAEGWTIKAITDHIEDLIPRVTSYFLVNTLEYLQRGGRIGKARAVLGNLLRVRPILGIRDGEVAKVDQVRGGKKAREKVLQLMQRDVASHPEQPIRAAVIHADAPKWADEMRQMLEAKFTCERILVSQIGPTVGAHCGPGTVAVVFYPVTG